MAYPKDVVQTRATRVTAGETWAFRNAGGVIRKIVMTYTADGSVRLDTNTLSAEASIIIGLQVSAGANRRYVTLLEDYAGDVYVGALTAKNIVNIQYE